MWGVFQVVYSLDGAFMTGTRLKDMKPNVTSRQVILHVVGDSERTLLNLWLGSAETGEAEVHSGIYSNSLLEK